MTIAWHTAALDDGHRESALALMRRHRETSLFLLGNLDEYGPVLTDHLNSGTYKVVLEGEAVVAVFVLTRRGNLLVQSDRRADYAAPIAAACAEEPVALGGLIGDWAVIEPLWRSLEGAAPPFVTTYHNRDILYRRATRPEDVVAVPGVRLLTPADFAEWEPLNRAFTVDEGLPVQGTLEQRRVAFSDKAEQARWWGYFQDGRLASMATMGIVVDGVGQVGGVYTPPEFRRRGYSGAVMRQLLAAAAGPMGLHTVVLFTGEQNVQAKAMYEALGFARIGHFALIFGHLA